MLKLEKRGSPLSIHLGTKTVTEKKKAILEQYAKRDNRKASRYVWDIFIKHAPPELRKSLIQCERA